jgi:hypothetical protein
MVRAMLWTFGLLMAVLAIGTSCQARYADVSADPKYADRVGQQCLVLKGLQAHGVALHLGNKVTDEVDVTTLPGISGPEITFTAPLPKGTTLNVIGARKCWNCPFNRIDYEVRIPDIQQLASYSVFARAETLNPDEVQCSKNP